MPAPDPARRSSNAGRRANRSRVGEATRRSIDRLAAALGLIVLAPVFLAVALIVWKDAGRPILFRQTRAGRGGAPFTILKFRTMEMRAAQCCVDPQRCIGLQMPASIRMSPWVEMLRRTGLDELPQLINILRGEMSFVGPRPLMPRYLSRYSEAQRRRHDVQPGITGWAQVNGRTDIPWDDKLAMDVWYADHRSLALDLRIIADTLRAAASGSGYSLSGSGTGTEFIGSGVARGLCPATELPLAEPQNDHVQPSGTKPMGAR